MHKLAKLSAEERQRPLDEPWDATFGGLDIDPKFEEGSGPPAPICPTTLPRSRSRPGSSWPSWSATPATGPGRCAMSEAHAAARAAGMLMGAPGLAERRPWPLSSSGPGRRSRPGIDPASAEARPIDEIKARIAADPAQAADPAFRRTTADQWAVGTDARVERYWAACQHAERLGRDAVDGPRARVGDHRAAGVGGRVAAQRRACRASPGEPAPFRAWRIEAMTRGEAFPANASPRDERARQRCHGGSTGQCNGAWPRGRALPLPASHLPRPDPGPERRPRPPRPIQAGGDERGGSHQHRTWRTRPIPRREIGPGLDQADQALGQLFGDRQAIVVADDNTWRSPGPRSTSTWRRPGATSTSPTGSRRTPSSTPTTPTSRPSGTRSASTRPSRSRSARAA